MVTQSKLNKPAKLAIAFAIVFAAAAIGSLATFPNIPNWYAGLAKPFFSPPNFVFGPVWTLLYSLMAVGLYLIWTTKLSSRQRIAFIWFGAQLALNTLWSVVFFGAHQLWLAVFVIIGMILAIAGTIISFWHIRKTAAYLFVPYIAWVTFATVLNVAVATLNS